MKARISLNGLAAATLAVMLTTLPATASGAAAEEYSSTDSTQDSHSEVPYVNDYGFIFDPMHPFVDEADTDLSTFSPGATVQPLTIELNPYGCKGKTENVHQSNGMVSLHARTYACSAPPNEIVVSPEIVKRGFFGIWYSLGSTPKDATNKTSLDSHHKRVCGDFSFHTYRGNAYHRVLIGSKNYVAQSSSLIESRLGCNAN